MSRQDPLNHGTTFASPLNVRPQYVATSNNYEFQHRTCMSREGEYHDLFTHRPQRGMCQGSPEGSQVGKADSNVKIDVFPHGHADANECPYAKGAVSVHSRHSGAGRERKSGFLCHMCGNMVRIATLLIRNPISNLLEFIFPILIVFLSIQMWRNSYPLGSSDSHASADVHSVRQFGSSGVSPNATTGALDRQGLMQGMSRPYYAQFGGEQLPELMASVGISPPGKLYFTPDTADTERLVSHLMKVAPQFKDVYGGTIHPSAVEDVERAWASGGAPVWGIARVTSLGAGHFNMSIRSGTAAKRRTVRSVSGAGRSGEPDSSTGERHIYVDFGTPPGMSYAAPLAPQTKHAWAQSYGSENRVVKVNSSYKDYTLLMAMFVLCGYFLFVIHVAKRIVIEKELQLREMMTIMGLSHGVRYTCWIIVYVIECGVMSLIIALVFKLMYLSEPNFFCIFTIFFLYSMALVTCFGFIAAFFNNARIASVISFLIYVILLISGNNVREKLMRALSPISSAGEAIAMLLSYQITSEDPSVQTTDLTYIHHLVLFLQFLAYGLLMLYFDAVLPKKWGASRSPFFFIVDLIRACGCWGKRAGLNDNREDGCYPNGVFEPMRDAGSYSVRIVGLTKVFNRGGAEMLAVNNLHWALHEGEVSVLLGHNGAGKTTLMNMLTGMSEISAGDCHIYDHSVRDQLSCVRQGLGYCPQQNILWPNLTCREHLRFYASIRGLSGAEREAIIEDMLASIGLTDKKSCLAKHLSGGQKRKLSVLNAFLAGTRFVLLDEPTAGVDALARRQIWDLTRSVASQRTILLSTHFMDEAETLGDSIAIIKRGRLRCAGSNVFLKSRLGVGYVLTVPMHPGAGSQRIADLVCSHEPLAKLGDSAAGELAFELPMSARKAFPRLLADIENHGEDLGVAEGYVVAATTLEQIFIRISQEWDSSDASAGQEEVQEAQRMAQEAAIAEASSSVWGVRLLHSGPSIIMSQLGAMFVKRTLFALRYRRIYIIQTILPIALTLFVVVLTSVTMEKNSKGDCGFAPILIYCLFLLILLFIPSTFVSPIVRERSCKARHLQKMSGLYFSIYWLSNFIFDMLSYLVTTGSILVIFAIFSGSMCPRFLPDGMFVLLLLLYGMSSVAMVYALSFLFKDHTTAQNTVLALFLFSGIALWAFFSVINGIKIDAISTFLYYILRIFPGFCITEICILKIANSASSQPDISSEIKIVTALFMAVGTVLFLIIALILDNPNLLRRFFRRRRGETGDLEGVNLESDVLKEQNEVMFSADRIKDPVRAEHLCKVYGNGKVAVSDLTFGVKHQEVFALLGANGAGKTTTISILCQELYPTKGSVAICGHDTVAESLGALRCIGYCPQFDATFDLLTAEEHLWFYAGVRGVEYAMRRKAIKDLLALCQLTEYKDVRADKLSGGNRRKLSVAISLVGGPRVVLLDEPSAGLDPVARHGLWLAVKAAADNCAVLLTTHHMEEVEVLAHRVAIMAMGTLRCIGTKTYLKNKYGSGYQVRVRVEKDSDDVQAAISDFFTQAFPACNLSEKHERHYTYDLHAHTKLSSVFRHLEGNVDRLNITDYTVLPKTIEQVLMRISENTSLSEVD